MGHVVETSKVWEADTDNGLISPNLADGSACSSLVQHFEPEQHKNSATNKLCA